MSTVDPFSLPPAPPASEVNDWRRGNCYAMAIALHELTDRPIAVLYSMRSERDPRWHPVHMALASDDDEIMDAGGKFSRQAIFDEYLPEGHKHMEYARTVGHWAEFQSLEALKDRLIAEEGRDFIERHGWPFITKMLPAAREFAERYLDLEQKVPAPEMAL